MASGLLDEALTRQLASNQSDTAPVHIGLTYRDESGAFCRTFTLIQDSATPALRAGPAMRGALRRSHGPRRPTPEPTERPPASCPKPYAEPSRRASVVNRWMPKRSERLRAADGVELSSGSWIVLTLDKASTHMLSF